MKRVVAKRRLKNGCDQCKQRILKGNVYYKKRVVILEDGEIFAFDINYCSKCKYKNEQHNKRFERFKSKCTHPIEFVEEKWSYIPGEAVMQPDHFECRLCGKWL